MKVFLPKEATAVGELNPFWPFEGLCGGMFVPACRCLAICLRSATPKMATCWWTEATSTTCLVCYSADFIPLLVEYFYYSTGILILLLVPWTCRCFHFNTHVGSVLLSHRCFLLVSQLMWRAPWGPKWWSLLTWAAGMKPTSLITATRSPAGGCYGNASTL